MPDKNLISFLSKQQFIYVGTCDSAGIPTVAPKPALRVESRVVYLADYLVGRTYENIKKNPAVCLSILDVHNAAGYVMRGKAKIIDSGAEFNSLEQELNTKQVKLAVQSVIQAVRGQKERAPLSLVELEPIVFFRIELEEIVKVESSGRMEKETITGNT